jgi:hypothetical protein
MGGLGKKCCLCEKKITKDPILRNGKFWHLKCYNDFIGDSQSTKDAMTILEEAELMLANHQYIGLESAEAILDELDRLRRELTLATFELKELKAK